jgi:ribulose-phosphate 3-epimerase
MNGMHEELVSFNMKIIPAILPLRYYDIKNGVEKIYGAADTVQVDFVDGHFATNRTWWFNNKNEDTLAAFLSEEEGLPHWEDMNYEFDLMVSNPIDHMEIFIALGPAKIIFHVESLEQEKMLAYFASLPEIVRSTIAFGIAIGIDTDPSLVAPYAQYIDTVQCMGIANVGFQGQPFDERVIEQVRKAHALFPDKIITVDGAVTLANAKSLAEAGASALVVGSAIFQSSDPHGTIQAFKKEVWQPATTQSEN